MYNQGNMDSTLCHVHLNMNVLNPFCKQCFVGIPPKAKTGLDSSWGALRLYQTKFKRK